MSLNTALKLLNTKRLLPQRLITTHLGACQAPASLRHQQQRFSSSENKRVIPITQMNPFVSLKNGAWSLMIKAYFQQDFDMEDFVETCPYAIEQLIYNMKNNEFHEMDDLMDHHKKVKLQRQWKKLDPLHKRHISRLTANEIHFVLPKILMRMPDKREGAEELPAFLNVKMIMMMEINWDIYKDHLDDLPKNPNFKQPSLFKLVDGTPFLLYPVMFERQITRGQSDDWVVENLGVWPALK